MRHLVRRVAQCAVALGLLLPVGGCPQPGQSVEFFRFTYKIAQRQPTGLYRLPWRAQDGTCNGFQDAPQVQIVQWIQVSNSGLLDCVADYTVEVANNRRLGIVSVRIHGAPATAQSDLQIRAGRAIVPGSFTEPTNMFLEGVGPITPGLLRGSAELNFGSAGPVFTTNRGSNTFFEHRLHTVDLTARRVAGSFRFLASNQNDPSDTRLLVVVDSGYLMNVD